MDTKIDMNSKMNKAISELRNISIKLNCELAVNDLERMRTFLATKIEMSKYPAI